MPPIVTKLQFAELCGVSQSAVQMAALKRTLKPALVNRKIDLAHPNAVRYMQKQATKAREYEAGRKRSGVKSDKPALTAQYTPADTTRFLQEYPGDIRKLADRSLRELVSIFGTTQIFEDWLKSIEKMEKIHDARLKNLEKEKKLVARDIVKKGIVEPFDSAHKRLLTDGSRSLSKRLVTMIRAGGDEEECEKYLRERMESFIKGAKATAVRILEEMLSD